MTLFTRFKKIIGIALLLTLIPATINSLSFNPLTWNIDWKKIGTGITQALWNNKTVVGRLLGASALLLIGHKLWNRYEASQQEEDEHAKLRINGTMAYAIENWKVQFNNQNQRNLVLAYKNLLKDIATYKNELQEIHNKLNGMRYINKDKDFEKCVQDYLTFLTTLENAKRNYDRVGQYTYLALPSHN